eukprot:2367112-Pleurochrysis_carterae.AAC.1
MHIADTARVPLHDVCNFANRYYVPSDGFSPHDAHPDGYGYNSAPHLLISLMTPEYEPPAFDFSNGLCCMPPRKASMVHGHGVGLCYWGREYQHYEYPFYPPYMPDIGESGTGPHWQMSLPPVWSISQLMPASPPPQQYLPLEI